MIAPKTSAHMLGIVLATITGRSVRVAPDRKPAPAAEDIALDTLSWPSGHGDEFGVIFDTIPATFRVIMRNGADATFDGVTVTKMREDGATAIVLNGLVPGPVSLVTEPGMPADRLAIVADAAVDRALLMNRLQPLLRGLRYNL